MADNLREFESYMRELPEKIKQAVRVSLERVGAVGVSQLSKLFQTEGRSLSVEWPPLNEKYLRHKIKQGFSEKKLHRTTTLAQSFHSRATDMEVKIGTPVPYSIYHEYGTKRMPARPFMKPVAQHLQERAVSDIFKKTLKELL
ncbi:MAG: phage virion morphogenesis protein [Candidatus Bathyarchaeia archaeon]